MRLPVKEKSIIVTGREARHGRRKEGIVCMTCGCGEPNADHGDPRHITYDQLRSAADAAEISVEEATSNIGETLKKV
jgi:hypothetical protein